jgi:UDPglucose 6-dehydrogenase
MTTAICGLGWVGKFMQALFPDSVIFDRNYPNKKEINDCDITFICVPTPCPDEGRLDISAVEENVAWCESSVIVIRSTVNPGDGDYLARKYNKHIVIQPEYLGETPSHPLLDPKSRPFLILGGEKEDTRKVIECYQAVYNAFINIRQVTRKEAELIKLSENRAISFKVAQCQELYDVCELTGMDYYTIREAVYGDDPRFNLWWTFIYPNKRGFNSKCIPKDVYAWCAFAESAGYNPEITRNILKVNKKWLVL